MKIINSFNNHFVKAIGVVTLAVTIGQSQAQQTAGEGLHESYRALVAESLVETARQASVLVDPNSFFMSTTEKSEIAVMHLKPPTRLSNYQLRKGVDQMLIWLSAKDSEVLLPGYYWMRSYLTREGKFENRLVNVSYPSVSIEIPSKFTPLAAGEECQGSSVEPGEGYVCLHTCGCEFWGQSHPDFGPAVSCYAITACIPTN